MNDVFHYLLTLYVDDERRTERVAVSVNWNKLGLAQNAHELFWREERAESSWLTFATIINADYATAKLCGIEKIHAAGHVGVEN